MRPNSHHVLFVLILLMRSPAIGWATDDSLPARLSPVAPPERLGPVWPIVEEDIRTTIMTRLKARLPELQDMLRNSLRSYRAPSIPRPTTDVARTLYIDPSMTLTADITTHEGKLIASAGQRVNPLAILPFRRAYLLINGADPRQVDWAIQQLADQRARMSTVLLTEGSVDIVKKTLPNVVRVFPAPPALFARFTIESVPARIGRDGDRMRIDLIPEKELPEKPEKEPVLLHGVLP